MCFVFFCGEYNKNIFPGKKTERRTLFHNNNTSQHIKRIQEIRAALTPAFIFQFINKYEFCGIKTYKSFVRDEGFR